MTIWDEKQLHWHLTTRRFGRQIRYFEEIDSTNRWLMEHPEEFTLTGGVVIAGHQTAGRGRFNRIWSDSPGAALLCSVLLKLNRNNPALGLLALLPAIALARSIRDHDRQAEVGLKWPNDVLLAHRKVAGILAESTGRDNVQYIVAGIGVNLNSVPAGEFIWPATCLKQSSTWHPTREVLLAELLNHFEPLFDDFADERYSQIRSAWEEFGPPPGAKMRRVEHGETTEGEFAGLGESGQLLLRVSDGRIQEIYSGDVLPL